MKKTTDLMLLRVANQKVKNKYLTTLGERKVRSAHPEYYDQAIKIVTKLAAGELIVCLLSARYQIEEIAQILQVKKGTVDDYRYLAIKTIREEVNSEVFYPNAAVIPYYIGLVDIDSWVEVAI